MKITLENYRSVSRNENILHRLRALLVAGDNLIASDLKYYGEYVCSSNAGTIQRIK